MRGGVLNIILQKAIDLCAITSIIDIEKCVLHIGYLFEKCGVRYALP